MSRSRSARLSNRNRYVTSVQRPTSTTQGPTGRKPWALSRSRPRRVMKSRYAPRRARGTRWISWMTNGAGSGNRGRLGARREPQEPALFPGQERVARLDELGERRVLREVPDGPLERRHVVVFPDRHVLVEVADRGSSTTRPSGPRPRGRGGARTARSAGCIPAPCRAGPGSATRRRRGGRPPPAEGPGGRRRVRRHRARSGPGGRTVLGRVEP